MSEQGEVVKSQKSTNINRLGYYLDGWADLVEGMGGKVEKVQNQIHEFLTERDMPEIEVNDVTGVTGITSSERQYTLTTTHPGATTAIYVGGHGKDLYVSWHTYIRPVPAWKRLVVMLVIAGILAACQGLTILLPGMGAAGSGIVREFNLFGPLSVIFLSFSCFAGVGGTIFALEALVLVLAGTVAKRNPLAFFFIEPDVFDADDIAAMSLSVHKSMLKALDKVGVDTALLRGKEEFYRKRGEAV